MVMRDIYIRLQKLEKLISNTQNSTIMKFFFGCVIFVAMATRRRNLQSILFLNHETQGFPFMNDDKGCLYHSTKLP